jgi:hypothetical protein
MKKGPPHGSYALSSHNCLFGLRRHHLLGAGYVYSRQKSNDADSDPVDYVEIHMDPVVVKDAARMLVGVQHEIRHVEAHQRAR